MKKAFYLSDNQAQSILANVEMENKTTQAGAQNKTAP
jgi:hypothetical protein